MYFSEYKQGFYDPDVHDNIPNDAIEISREVYEDIMDKLSLGGHVVIKDNGVLDVNKFPVETSYLELRREAILAEWSVAAQLEAFTENMECPPRPEKMEALLNHIKNVKRLYPK